MILSCEKNVIAYHLCKMCGIIWILIYREPVIKKIENNIEDHLFFEIIYSIFYTVLFSENRFCIIKFGNKCVYIVIE